MRNALLLAACIIAIVFIAPGFGLIGNFSMLKCALIHDNIVMSRYFDKQPHKAIELDAGELQYELEDAPNSLRIHWINVLGYAVALSASWAYLLYCAGNIR